MTDSDSDTAFDRPVEPPLDPPFDPVADCAYAFGVPVASGQLRSEPQDFRVDEIPGFTPKGSGDHVYLTLEKTGLTTADVSRSLRQFCAVGGRDVGHAGRKDKQAVTTQQFSINLAGREEPDWQALESAQLRVLAVSRHPRKLKTGVLKGNRFGIRVRQLAADQQALEARLQMIREQGVPNYFGPQRFGRDGRNLVDAAHLLAGESGRISRDSRSMLISTARSLLFNALLDARVRDGSWDSLLTGEVINLDGTARHFAEPLDQTLMARAKRLDVHATGPLYGIPSRALEPTEIAGELEQEVLSRFPQWLDGLCELGLEHARRPLRLAVRELDWELSDGQLELSFSLTSGAYATAVLREILGAEAAV